MGEPYSILLVADDPRTGELLRACLEPHLDVAALKAISDRDAVFEALACNDGDLIISDATLGPHTGLEVIDWVKELGLDVPVILLGDVDGAEDEAEALKRGAVGYIAKTEGYIDRVPVSVSAVLERVRKLRALETEVRHLRRSESRWRDLYDNTPDVYFTIIEDGTVISVNRFGAAYIGYTPEELQHFPLWNFIHPDDRKLVREQINDVFRREVGSSALEFRLVRRDQSVIWVQERATLSRGSFHGDAELQLVCRDITQQRSLEEQLKFDAFHDALTGLPNRALFLDRVQRSLARAERHSEYLFAVLFLDLDRFKIVNDSLGHGAGDELLVTIANRMHKYLRTGDSIARLGGDEFCILLDDLRSISDATRFAERIQDEICKPVRLGDNDVTVSASIGIASSASNYRSPYAVLRDADTAMYRAKELGKSCFALFDKSMHSQVVRRLSLEQELRTAIRENQFEVWYQPVIDLQSGKIAGCEALLRWNHPVRGIVEPQEFLAVLEDTGGTIPVGKWMIDELCRDACSWSDRLEPDQSLAFSMNLSSRQLAQPDLAQHFAAVIRKSGLEQCALHLEVTEDLIMSNSEAIAKMLVHLGDESVRLSIDEFGKGYSSVSNLHQMPISHLKVGRDFVASAVPGSKAMHVVKTILALAREIGVTVVAVGVETEEQLEVFREVGCEFAQGHFISPPVRADDFIELVRSGRHW